MKSDLLIHYPWPQLRRSLVEIMTALESIWYPAMNDYFLFQENRFIVALKKEGVYQYIWL